MPRFCARLLAWLKAGISNAVRMPMMAITVINSTKVKAAGREPGFARNLWVDCALYATNSIESPPKILSAISAMGFFAYSFHFILIHLHIDGRTRLRGIPHGKKCTGCGFLANDHRLILSGRLIIQPLVLLYGFAQADLRMGRRGGSLEPPVDTSRLVAAFAFLHRERLGFN